MSTITFHSSTGDRTAVAAWDETILDALIRSGAPVPFFCRAGICGQCKSVLVAGELETVGAPSHLLTVAERHKGVVLLCKSRAVTDCEIQPFNEIMSSQATAWPSKFAVESRVNVHSTLVEVRLVAIAVEAPLIFRAGQFTRLSDPEFAALPAIFLASRPGLPYLDLYLPLDGPLSAVAAQFVPGATVPLDEPTGSASFRDGETGPTIVFAEGSGIASALGMIETVAALGTAAPATAFVLHGSAAGALERRVTGVAEALGLDASVVARAEDVPAALERALALAAAQLPSGRVRAYVKATREVAKAVRQVLLRGHVRPWDTYVDGVADAKLVPHHCEPRA